MSAARISEIRHRAFLRCGELLNEAETVRESGNAIGEGLLLNAAAKALLDGARAALTLYNREADADGTIANAILADMRTVEDLTAAAWGAALPAMQPVGAA